MCTSNRLYILYSLCNKWLIEQENYRRLLLCGIYDVSLVSLQSSDMFLDLELNMV